MNRIIQRYLYIIISTAIVLMSLINYALTGAGLRREARLRFQYALDQIQRTLLQNQQELEEIKRDLYGEYITKTTAFAYIIHDRPEILESRSELRRMRQLLDVDEVCVTDSKGVIRYSSDLSYIGLDFSAHEQTRFFLPILSDPNLQLVQEIEKNASHGEEFQYAGVSRIGEPGIVQIGMKPTRLLRAQERCDYPYLFSRMPMEEGEAIFAVNGRTGEILAHSNQAVVGRSLSDLGDGSADLESCEKGGFLRLNGEKRYVVTRRMGDVTVGLSVPVSVLYRYRLSQTGWLALYLAVSGGLIIIVLSRLLRVKIVDSMTRINRQLEKIEEGSLDLVVCEDAAPEFQAMSGCINRMVESLVGISGKISRIINTTGVNFGAFEYDKATKHLMLTDRVQCILGLEDQQFNQLKDKGSLFLEYLSGIMSHPLEREQDIYLLDRQRERWVRIVMTENDESVAGTVTDISEDMKKRLYVQFERDHDALTGLNNYRLFRERVTALLLEALPGRTAASVMIDMDRFKSINDTWGHDFGDAYLQRMAKVLRTLETSGVLTCRRAGDEFCIFFYNWNSKDEIRGQMRELERLMSEHLLVFPDGESRMLRASYGLAWAEPKEISFENLMNNADNALYHAKKEAGCHYMEFVRRFENSGGQIPENL